MNWNLHFVAIWSSIFRKRNSPLCTSHCRSSLTYGCMFLPRTVLSDHVCSREKHYCPQVSKIVCRSQNGSKHKCVRARESERETDPSVLFQFQTILGNVQLVRKIKILILYLMGGALYPIINLGFLTATVPVTWMDWSNDRGTETWAWMCACVFVRQCMHWTVSLRTGVHTSGSEHGVWVYACPCICVLVSHGRYFVNSLPRASTPNIY